MELSQIRYLNLKLILEHMSRNELAYLMDRDKGFLGRYLSNKNRRPIGPGLAAAIALVFKKPADWLNQLRTRAEISHAIRHSKFSNQIESAKVYSVSRIKDKNFINIGSASHTTKPNYYFCGEFSLGLGNVILECVDTFKPGEQCLILLNNGEVIISEFLYFRYDHAFLVNRNRFEIAGHRIYKIFKILNLELNVNCIQRNNIYN